MRVETNELPARLGAARAVAVAAGTARGRLRTRLVDGQLPAADRVRAELTNGFLRLLVGRHLDKRETARAAGGGVAHYVDGFNGAGSREQLLQILVIGFVR